MTCTGHSAVTSAELPLAVPSSSSCSSSAPPASAASSAAAALSAAPPALRAAATARPSAYASLTRSTASREARRLTVFHANLSVVDIWCTSTRKSIAVSESGTASRSRPATTHASTSASRERKKGIACADCSWSVQKTGSCHAASGSPCFSTCSRRKGPICSRTAALPCSLSVLAMWPCGSSPGQPPHAAKARPSGVTPRCSPRTSGIARFADSSTALASAGSV
mmetsp:Transcript_807/g.2353  ORF Transcript_807/g.2353 Transcript_807/m.2353 type:complete len:224 (-) Transcript_807:855-1526(-)